jgi:hypothetical protein
MTFEQVCEWEPRLEDVGYCMKAIRDSASEPSFCANIVWYTLVKPRVVALVGFKVPEKRGGLWNLADGTVTGQEDTPPELRSAKAYRVVYRHLYEQLPACRNCRCFNW